MSLDRFIVVGLLHGCLSANSPHAPVTWSRAGGSLAVSRTALIERLSAFSAFPRWAYKRPSRYCARLAGGRS